MKKTKMNLNIMKTKKEFKKNKLPSLNQIKFIFTKIGCMTTRLSLLKKKKSSIRDEELIEQMYRYENRIKIPKKSSLVD